MQGIRLTPTSYIVLGLLELAGESTPYGLKQLMAGSVGYFWTLQPARLAEAGYVTEKREETGRRRKLYALTDKGRRALEEWRTESTSELAELREPALLKLFFVADQKALAATQIPANEAQLTELEQIRDTLPDDVPEGPRQTLEMGMRFQRAMIAFWQELAEGRPRRE